MTRDEATDKVKSICRENLDNTRFRIGDLEFLGTLELSKFITTNILLFGIDPNSYAIEMRINGKWETI